MSADAWHALTHIRLADALDILLLAVILYSFLRLIQDTKAYQMVIGLAVVGFLYLFSRLAKLTVSHWMIKNFLTYLIIAIIVLFQGEIRRFLTGIGSRTIRKPLALRSFQEKIEDLFLAVDYMARHKIGALIAVTKEISLKAFADRGTRLDAVLSKDLLVSLFYPHSPLHDGAVIVEGNRILAAGCLLPLPATHNLREDMVARTRHLAALGLSQETDAAVIVVSEQTGDMTLAAKGELERMPDINAFKERLLEYLRNE
ncbi:MAG: diadenylate cyclase CdaA [Candidatus Aminicenantes bacterium]|nr:diadenylate cyclase CdaA [Candidatus Aminicenantes bacterium]